MLLAIPHFTKGGSEQRAEIVRVEDIRKMIVRVLNDYTEIILIKDEPIGRIHVKRDATVKALESLYRIMRMPDNYIKIVTIDEEGEIKLFDTMLKKAIGGENEKV